MWRQCLLLVLSAIGSGIVCAQNTSYQGMWWVQAESGWGFNIAHQGDVIAAAWYTYDTDGKPLWLVLSAPKQSDGSFSGAVYRTTGRPFAQINGTPATSSTTQVGTATLRFTSASAAQLSYIINGVSQQKNMTRYNFSATPPTCAFTTSPMTAATNYTDLWWNASESGWGVNLIHQGDVVAAAWYTYATNGNPMWLIASPNKQPDGSYSGRVFRASAGTPLLRINGAPAVQAGAIMSFTVDGTTQTKNIQRYAFSSPRSVCTAAASGGGSESSDSCYPSYAVGDRRTYRSTSQIGAQPQVIGETSEQVTGTATYEGHPVVIVESRDAQNRLTAKSYYEQTATELVQWGVDTHDAATGLKIGTIKYVPEFRTPRSFNLNETLTRNFDTITTVTTQGFTYNSTDRHQLTLKLVGRASTAVPAGTFVNVCKLEVNDTVAVQATGTSIAVNTMTWANSTLGTIKTIGTTPTPFGANNTLVELMSASVGGVNVP
jgi:uncharacterized Zn-binding protein involved in type VI secretion